MLFKCISALEYPQCDASATVCHLAKGRDCAGYQILHDENLDSENLIWMEENMKKIVIVKKAATIQMAVNSCKALCGKLYEPHDFDETLKGFSQIASENDLDHIFIGVTAQKMGRDIQYHYSSNASDIIGVDDTNFIDFVLDAVVEGESMNGNYSLMIHTDPGSNRFNKFGLPNNGNYHYFACEKNAEQENQPTQGTIS